MYSILTFYPTAGTENWSLRYVGTGVLGMRVRVSKFKRREAWGSMENAGEVFPGNSEKEWGKCGGGRREKFPH